MADKPELLLFDYWRSSASYRVRIALHLKGLKFRQESIHLAKGEQKRGDYLFVNPQGLVPALVHDERVITQSLAICGYIDDIAPEPPLLPEDPVGRAQVRALAMTVACDIHPLQNLRVLKYVSGPLGGDEDAVSEWRAHWVGAGFKAYEALLARNPRTGRFSYGDQPTLADVFLVPQVYNAERFALDLEPYPRMMEIVDRCRGLDAFAAAAPEAQPDAVT